MVTVHMDCVFLCECWTAVLAPGGVFGGRGMFGADISGR